MASGPKSAQRNSEAPTLQETMSRTLIQSLGFYIGNAKNGNPSVWIEQMFELLNRMRKLQNGVQCSGLGPDGSSVTGSITSSSSSSGSSKAVGVSASAPGRDKASTAPGVLDAELLLDIPRVRLT